MLGEKAIHVIQHCLDAWIAWGKPQQLKTDNGPAYTTKTFMSFCQQMEVQMKHGIPYNPQGQGIIERTHRTIKQMLQKQKGGIGHSHTPKMRLYLVLYTLNF
jgi:transposase InsO family protein